MNPLPCALNKSAKIESRIIGSHKILVIDDFLEAPKALVSFASNAPFAPYPGMQERKGYPGIRAHAPEAYSFNLTTFLEPIIKNVFEVPDNKDIRKSMCAMSLMTTPAADLGPLQRTPHFDSSSPHHIAALLYLCGPEHGGTAFYRHKSTGLERITCENVDSYLDRYYEEINQIRPAAEYNALDETQFVKTGMIEAKFNRLVVYRGSTIHNAYINAETSISSNPTEGRLTINTFFDF